jgi:hypothetical protein
MSWYTRGGTRYRRYVLRLVAVAAFAGTAALAVVLTRVPVRASLAAAEDLACTATRISIAADGGVVPTYTLEFVNISHRTCVLYGYPVVAAYAGARQVGSPATLDTSVRPRTVTLGPGDAAHATLRYTGTTRFGAAICRQVTASWLRVYPPHQAGAMFVRWRVPACSRRGPHFLTVAAIQPRSGILQSPNY